MADNSRRIFLSRSDFLKELVSLWRVVVAVVLAQVSSGCVGVVLKPYGFWFIDFWFYGAVASIFGFAVGLFWQIKAVDGSWRAHRNMILLIGAMSVVLLLAALVLPLERAVRQINEPTGFGGESSDQVPSEDGVSR